MAAPTGCSICDKGQGICLCAGCNKYFCVKDFRSHRDTLFNEMEAILHDRNDLHEKITKASQTTNSSAPLLVQIDQWQKDVIKKVKDAAEQARKQVKQIWNSKQTKITTQIETLSQELVHRKETEDFIESDLVRLRQKVQQLNQDLMSLNQVPAIEFHTEQSYKIVWNQFILVDKRFSARRRSSSPAYRLSAARRRSHSPVRILPATRSRSPSPMRDTSYSQQRPAYQNEENEQMAASSAQQPLSCGGVRCSRCDKCRGPRNTGTMARTMHALSHPTDVSQCNCIPF